MNPIRPKRFIQRHRLASMAVGDSVDVRNGSALRLLFAVQLEEAEFPARFEVRYMLSPVPEGNCPRIRGVRVTRIA